MQVTFHDLDLASRRFGLAFLVTESDPVDRDVPPLSRTPVDDLEYRALSKKRADIPGVPVEPFAAAGPAVETGRRANRLSVDDQIDAGFAWAIPSTINKAGNMRSEKLSPCRGNS